MHCSGCLLNWRYKHIIYCTKSYIAFLIIADIYLSRKQRCLLLMRNACLNACSVSCILFQKVQIQIFIQRVKIHWRDEMAVLNMGQVDDVIIRQYGYGHLMTFLWGFWILNSCHTSSGQSSLQLSIYGHLCLKLLLLLSKILVNVIIKHLWFLLFRAVIEIGCDNLFCLTCWIGNPTDIFTAITVGQLFYS